MKMRRLNDDDASGTKSKRFKSSGAQHAQTLSENIYYDGLEPLVLTTEEEIEFRQLYDWSQGSKTSCCPSPPRETEDNDDDQAQLQGTVTEQVHDTGSPHLHVHSHQKLVEFLTTTGTENQAELLATNKWNSKPEKVFKLFNVTKCIVHPDYFLASESFPDNKITTIIAQLEVLNMRKPSKTYYAWSYLKKRLEPFLACFEGFEKLADIFHVHDVAMPMKNIFASKIQLAEKACGIGWYEPFVNWTRRLADADVIAESAFKEYTEKLFLPLMVITNGRFALRSTELKLVLPAQKYSPAEKTTPVKPDIMVQATLPEIMLVGKVKQFGSELRDQEHTGRNLCHVHPDIYLRPTPQTALETDQSRGQGDQLFPTVNEKEKSVPSVTADESHASTSKGQTGKSTEKEILIPTRSLDSKEAFKVDKYLPQLFGQMLAAMENNRSTSYRFRFCQPYENVQFGFAVEGFKLRFVKLTMIDVMKKELPTVRALLTGQRIKCHISITQEYNLLKRHHLEMFYQMLLAMRYSCY